MAAVAPQATTLLRRQVWSARLRGLHWAMATSCGLLLATGWLYAAGHGAPDYRILELHRATGYVLVAAIGARVLLLFAGHGAERFADLIPRGPQRRAAGATLVFYLSLGRAPLPAWYAHNPAWGPVYLLMLALLATACAAGVARSAELHAGLATASAVVLGLHVAAVVLHDWRGGSADVSAMLNGARTFEVREASSTPSGGGIEVSIEPRSRAR